MLKRSGIEPSPERSNRTTWSTFLKAHWKVLAASDFLTAEIWTTRGLVTHYLLFVISLADRVVHIVGITRRPDEAWMLQAGAAERLREEIGSPLSRNDRPRYDRLWGAAERLEETGSSLPPNDRPRYDPPVAAARAALGDDAAFDRAWQEGRALTLEQAIHLALDETVEQP